MKTFLALALLVGCFLSSAQTQLTDERDSQVYETLQIKNLVWTKEHMRYRTSESWCEKFPESGACDYGNYYFPTELETVCPKGWRIPTWEDYHSSVKYLIDSLQIDSVIFENDILVNKKKGIYADIIRGINIINDSLYFDMEQTGWIEGMKWEPQDDQTTIWVNEENQIYQTHIHIRPDGFLKHAHKHSIIDKPKRLRRFSVRCVCDASDL